MRDRKDRKRVQFHSGCKVTTKCKTCGVLVFIECMTSLEHDGHSFKKLKDSLRESIDNIEKRVNIIEKEILPAVDKELACTAKENAEQVAKRQTEQKSIEGQRLDLKNQIDNCSDDVMTSLSDHFDRNTKLIDVHKDKLLSLREHLIAEKNDCFNVLQTGSDIIKYDSGFDVTDSGSDQIPKHPDLSNKRYTKHEDTYPLIKQIVCVVNEKWEDKLNVSLEAVPTVSSRNEYHIYKLLT